jgi:cupin fold WbuC family metalloprotein
MQGVTPDQSGVIAAARLDELVEAARNSPRGRAHLLLHAGHQDPVQRLLISLEPRTYVRAHKHSEQWEMLILLRGKVDILLLSDDAKLSQRFQLSAAAPVIQIPMKRCHSAVSMEPGSVLMEVKPGPFRANEFMDWAPEEGSPLADAFLSWIRKADIGAGWSSAGNIK